MLEFATFELQVILRQDFESMHKRISEWKPKQMPPGNYWLFSLRLFWSSISLNDKQKVRLYMLTSGGENFEFILSVFPPIIAKAFTWQCNSFYILNGISIDFCLPAYCHDDDSNIVSFIWLGDFWRSCCHSNVAIPVQRTANNHLGIYIYM